jgi:glutaredoxin
MAERPGASREPSSAPFISESSADKHTLPQKLLAFAKADLQAYMREYLCPEASQPEPLDDRHVSLINRTDAVMFERAGCRYCELARRVLDEQRTAEGDGAFALETVAVDATLKSGLSTALNCAPITFPAIFIRGAYIGGSDELQRLVSQGSFAQQVRQPFAEFAPAAARKADSPVFCSQADGAAGLTFQLQGYGNVIRAYSLVHVVVFCLVLGLRQEGHHAASAALLVYLVVDLFLFIVNGPAPLCPTGVLVQHLVWRRRGPPTSLLPYKFVFGVYVATLVPLLSCYFKGVETASHFQDCVPAAALASLLVNSSSLAILRL